MDGLLEILDATKPSELVEFVNREEENAVRGGHTMTPSTFDYLLLT